MTILEKINLLTELERRGGVTPFVGQALDKLLQHEAEEYGQHLRDTEAELAEFERRYGLASDEFFRRWQAGEAGDSVDYTEWAALAQRRVRLREQLSLLTAGLAA